MAITYLDEKPKVTYLEGDAPKVTYQDAGLAAPVMLPQRAAPMAQPSFGQRIVSALKWLAPPPEQTMALMAPAALETKVGMSPIPALNETAQLLSQLKPATTMPGQVGQALAKAPVSFAQGMTAWEMLPLLGLGGIPAKLAVAGLMGKSAVEAPFAIKDVYQRPGVMSDKDKQDIADIITSGVLGGWLGGKALGSGVGDITRAIRTKGGTVPPPVPAGPIPPKPPTPGESDIQRLVAQGVLPPDVLEGRPKEIPTGTTQTTKPVAPLPVQEVKPEPVITKGAPNAEAIRSSEGRVEVPGLQLERGEEARRDDIQRPSSGTPVEAAQKAAEVGPSPSVLSGERTKDFEALALKAAKEPRGREAFTPEETEFMDRLSDEEYARWQKRYSKILYQRRQQGLETMPPGPEDTWAKEDGGQLRVPDYKPGERLGKDEWRRIVAPDGSGYVSFNRFGEDDGIHMEWLSVNPAQRGSRTGDWLLQKLEQAAKENNVSYLSTAITSDTPQNYVKYIRYLEKRGWRSPEGKFSDAQLLDMADDSFYMEKDLRRQGLETMPPGGEVERVRKGFMPGSRPPEATPSVTLMKELLGEHPSPKDKMGNYPRVDLKAMEDGDLIDLYQRLASRVQTLRKELHPDVGGSTESMTRVNTVWSALEPRLKEEATKRGLDLRKKDTLETMPPGFEERERELRGPFQLSSVDLATDAAKMGFKDINTPLDAQQVRGRIRNKIPASEWDMVKDALPEKGRISPNEAAKLLQEKGPRVEVRTKENLGQTKKQRRLEALEQANALVHQLETAGYTFIDPLNVRYKGRSTGISHMETLNEIPEAHRALFKQLADLRERQAAPEGWDEIGEGTNWSSISPKPESEMKGYVEIAVVKPSRLLKTGEDIPEARIMDRNLDYTDAQFPSTHSFPPNTLAFARGYMEGDTFHVVEVQSDWAQSQREVKERYQEHEPGRARLLQEQRGDPLLAHYERLALKAAVDHAIKQGAKRIAVQDAESAMMTEGHDRQTSRRIESTPENVAIAKKVFREGMADESVIRSIAEGRGAQTGEGYGSYVKHLMDEYGFKPVLPQEPGMRLHYDRTLPKILSELTGDKGERVSFGEHKMAFDPNKAYGEFNREAEMRKDLIFRNPDGTPKTDVTARSFSLEKVKTPFSLLGSDKPGKTLETSVPDVSKIPAPHLEELAKMGLHKEGGLVEGQNALDVANAIAADPKFFGTKYAQMAKWMSDNFDHILQEYGVRFDDGGTGRAYTDNVPGDLHMGLAVESGNPSAIVARYFHEAGHVMYHYLLMAPRTARERAASARILDVMEQAKERMPDDVKAFWENEWKKGYEDNDWERVYQAAQKTDFDLSLWSSVFHSLNSPSEWAAMTWESVKGDAFRNWLNSWNYRDTGQSAWMFLWDSIKSLFGAKPGTALDATLDSMIQLGKESDPTITWKDKGIWRVGEYDHTMSPLAALERATMPPTTEPPPMPGEPGKAAEELKVKNADLREKVRAKANQFAGYSLPRIFAASKEAANAGIRYASARIAAPLVARSLATQALGEHYKSAEFNRVLGDVLIEDRLRAIKQGWLDAARDEKDEAKKKEFQETADSVRTLIGAEGHALKTEEHYQRLLKNQNIQDVIERHKKLVMPLAEQQHVETGGKLARPGEQTGAFVNLMAVFAPDDVKGTRALVYGSRRGDITNPLRRGSVFSKQARGTAEMYERSYRTMVERMIRGNYEQTALREFYTALEKEGLAVEAKPGVKPPENTRKITIEIRGGGPGMTRQRNLWVRNDVYDEVRHALAVDDPLLRSSAGRMFAQAVTELQVVGATDAAYHTMNMFAAILTAPGGKNLGVDLLRKVPGVNIVDATARIVHNIGRIVIDSPEVQKELATMAEAGAGRAEPMHSTYLQRGLKSVFGEKGKYGDPSYLSSKFIKLVDKAGRLSLNHMYENLVARGWAENSVEARREFINRMGQYNERLMPRLDAWLRAANISSFVVAGKNFNRLAFQRFLADPGVMAEGGPGSKAWWALRAQDAIGSIIAVGVFSYVMNKAITGTPWGRPGTPAGAIDTGKDDERGRPIVIDPAQLTLWRRALRISGAQAAYRGATEHLGGREITHEMGSDVLNGLIHPYAGPVVRTASAGLTGYDVGGYLVSRNPQDPVENLIAATKNANPMVASYFRGAADAQEDEKKSKGLKEVGRSLLSSTGFLKKGRAPTFEQQMVEKKGSVPPLGTKARRDVSKEIAQERKERGPGDVLATRAMALRNLERQFGEEDALRSAVAPDVRSFLDKHQLKLPAFRDELTVARVKEPLTREEQQRFEKLVVEQYNERIRKFIPHLPADKTKQQEALNTRLTMARNRARYLLRKESRNTRSP